MKPMKNFLVNLNPRNPDYQQIVAALWLASLVGIMFGYSVGFLLIFVTLTRMLN
jgi:hypothetical protein